MIGFPCITDADCPASTGVAGTASRCRPRGCEGYICTCDKGYVPSIDQMGCQKGTPPVDVAGSATGRPGCTMARPSERFVVDISGCHEGT